MFRIFFFSIGFYNYFLGVFCFGLLELCVICVFSGNWKSVESCVSGFVYLLDIHLMSIVIRVLICVFGCLLLGVIVIKAGAAVMTTRICVAIRSFAKHPLGLPPCARKIPLPDTRVLYTVLRSPHIDKKSREQFHMITKKQLLIINAKANQLQKRFFWLKRQRILGAQYEIIFNSKTRLDKGKLQGLLKNETETVPAAELG